MQTLFNPVQLGSIKINNRIIMAPLTRSRTDISRVPNDLMVEYYRQRASAGLIITEATAISAMGFGWYGAPALYQDDHEAGWRKITHAVHSAGGKIVLQMWHMGRVSHPDNLNGATPLAPSAIKADGTSSTPNGRKEYVMPRAMTGDDMDITRKDYIAGARRAINAGFDGVEIHAAHGYLLDQFIRDSANQRTDNYGGSIDNRLRFPLEIVQAVSEEIGADRTGIRISPNTPHNSMHDSNPVATFSKLVTDLNPLDLAYLHIREDLPQTDMQQNHFITPILRNLYEGNIIVNGGYTKDMAQKTLEKNGAEAIAFGRPFIANPDLVYRFKQGLPLNEVVPETMYAGGAEGYVDYNFAT